MANRKITQSLPHGFKLQSKERTYEIIKVLGSGSFGITYLAVSNVVIGNISTTVKFAIKEHFVSASCYRGDDQATVLTVPSAKIEAENSLADFITEANRLTKICGKSRNIVSVNEAFEANGTAYYVMEYLDGGSPKHSSEEEAVSIVKQVAEALKVIHQEHVLHLDIKPDNIVLKTDEKNETYPVLIDFGIAKHFDSQDRPTSSLNAKGASPGYAPQEQYAGVSEFSPSYDIYALGAVLFYLCTGKNPPDAFKISPNQQELTRELDGKVSPKVKRAILNAMKPNVWDRTSSIDSFCEDLNGSAFSPFINVNCGNLDFDNESSQYLVDIESNTEWSVKSNANWCTVSKKKDSIEILVSNNNGLSNRNCTITIADNSNTLSKEIHISQQGAGTVVFKKTEPSTWWVGHKKKVFAAIGALLGIVFVICLFILIMPNSNDGQTQPSEDFSSTEVSNVVATPSVNNQSSDNSGSEPTAQESNDEKFARATNNFGLMLNLANDNYAKAYYPLAMMYYKKNDTSNAKKWAQKAVNSNTNRKQAQQLLTKLTANNPTDDELFAKATSINEFKALANKGYKKAYAPLAELYLNNRDYDNAHIWAVKAGNANVDVSRARKVVNTLSSYGYYDNGEHGGKPTF